MQQVGRVVVLRALGLGDLLTALPALRALRDAAPRASLALAAPGWLAPVALLSGALDELVDTAPLAPLADRLAGADLAVNLHGRGPQSTALLRATGPGRLLAYGEDGRDWCDDEHEVRRWCRLLAQSGVPADPRRLDLAVPDVVPVARGAVLVHPGSAAPARRWPAERWARVAEGVSAAVQGPVLVSAGPGEEPLARDVAERAGLGAQSVVAGLDLLALVALVAASRLVLAPDTGVAHLATAVGTPSVVLFGPVPPSQWGPPPDRPRHVALWRGPASDPTASAPAPALLALTPADVLAAAARAAAC